MMKIRVTSALICAALLVLPAALFAQAAKPATTQPQGTTVTLVYHEDNSGTFQVNDASGNPVTVADGDTLALGYTVLTGKGDVAELQVLPTKTVIKLAAGTSFKISSLRADLKTGADTFTLAAGKIRTVAGAASGQGQLKFNTQSAVCGVRGTDAVIEFLNNAVTTIEGEAYVEIGGAVTSVLAGFSFDSQSGAVSKVAEDILSALQSEMAFAKASVADAQAAHDDYVKSLSVTTPTTGEGGTTTTAETTPPPPEMNPFIKGIMDKLKEILGMQIGSVTIAGETWSTVVIQPTFALGELKASLYLPIIYSGDMFNPNDWYKPEGNNEWSFGTDTQYQNDIWGMVGDITSDLFLKIRYLEWGQQRDAFFFKVGNLNDITIGHGLIMRNFANDADFPSVRRVGLNLGMDFGTVGIEAMVNDVRINPAPDIIGGRFYLRPVKDFKAALGLSAVVDLQPAKDWPGGAALVGDPVFINPGLDLDLPIFESDFFSIVAFADGAAMLPYFRSAPSAASFVYNGNTVGLGGIPSGFALDAIYDPGSAIPIKNWGVAAGLFGNLIIKDFTWRVEFRDYTGAFVPQFYNSDYERNRTSQVASVLSYLSNPSAAAFDTPTLGIFGEGGLILPKLFGLTLSYFWPWTQDAAGAFSFGNDHLLAKFTLEKGVIPVVDISGSVSYERTNFVPALLNSSTNGPALFDANTVVSATINYPVTENVDVTLLYTTTAKRDATTGDVLYDPTSPGGLLPQLDTSLSIQTSVHL